MSIRSALPRAGDTPSQLWAHSLEARELVDKLDAINQTALADLVRDFFGSDGQMLRVIDNQVTKWKGELLRLSDPLTANSADEAPAGADEDAGVNSPVHQISPSGPSPGALLRRVIDFGAAGHSPAPVVGNEPEYPLQWHGY